MKSAGPGATVLLHPGWVRTDMGGPGATVLLHPGWVRTDMGGPGAPLDVPTSARGMADTIASLAVSKGVHYVDYQGKVLPW